jgi:hypothetical protein
MTLERPTRRQSHAIVQYLKDEPLLETLRTQNDGSAPDSFGDAVADRILNQRLDEKAGNKGIVHFWIDSHLDLQRIAEADLLDGEIVIKKS